MPRDSSPKPSGVAQEQRQGDVPNHLNDQSDADFERGLHYLKLDDLYTVSKNKNDSPFVDRVVSVPHVKDQPKEAVLPSRIYVSMNDISHIENNATLLAKFFSKHHDAYHELYEYGASHYGKNFNLTLHEEEYNAVQNRSFFSKLIAKISNKKDVLTERAHTRNPEVTPFMIKKYASIIGFYLERHPDLVGSIENETRVIVGDVIKRVSPNGEASFPQEAFK